MFKGRPGVWAGVIAACLAISFLINVMPNFFRNLFFEEKVTVSVNASMDDMLASELNRYSFKKLQLYYTTEGNPDVIIQDASSDTIEGYTKYENKLSSTLVMYVRNSAIGNPEGFIYTNSTESSPMYIDLKRVLEVMENGGSWKELNINTRVVNGDVVLYIPQKSDPWYPMVEELFYVTLNDGKTPSTNERAKLKPRVDAIIDKCVQAASISQGIQDEYNKETRTHKVFIGPEYLFMPVGYSMSRRNQNAFIPVNIKNSPIVYMDVFAKSDSKVAESFISKITETCTFMAHAGWRVKDYTFDIKEISYCLVDVL